MPNPSVSVISGPPGPASIKANSATNPIRRLTARWCGVLELQPQEGLHVLSIVEGADITWNGMGNFAADELYVWLAEVPVPEPAVNPLPPQDPADAGHRLGSRIGPRPA